MTNPTIISTLGTIIVIIILGIIAYYTILLVAGIIKFFLIGIILVILGGTIINYFRSLFKKK